MKKKLLIFVLLLGMVGTVSAVEYSGNHEDNDISEYSGDTGSFTTSSTNPKFGSYHLDGSHSGSNVQITTSSDWDFPQGSTLETHVNFKASDGFGVAAILFGYQDSNNYYRAEVVDGESGDAIEDAVQIYKIDGGSATQLGKTSTNDDSTVTDSAGYYNFTIEWTGSGGITATVYDSNGNQLVQNSVTDSTFSSGDVGYRIDGRNPGTVFYDAKKENSPPSIDSKEIDPTDPNLDNSIDAAMNTSDADGDPVTHTLSVWEDSTKINDSVSMNSGTASDAVLNNVFKSDQKGSTYYVQFEADDGSVTTKENISFSIQDNAPTVSISKPKNQNYTSKKVNYSFSASDSDDVAGENYQCELFNNGNSFKNLSSSEPLSNSDNITSSIHDPQSNSFKVECDDPSGNQGSLTQSYYIWRGLNVSAFQKDTGNPFTSWNIYLSNSTQNYSKKNLTNPQNLEYDNIPNGNVTVTVGDGESNLYYFNKTFYRTINSTEYYKENVSLNAKPENPLTLEFDPGLLIDEGTEIKVDGTATQGNGTLERDGAVVSNPYQATLSEGLYTFNFSIGETKDYAPNFKTSTLQVLAAGEGCTTNTTFAFQKDINPTTNPYLVDFSDFIDSDRVRPNLGDVYTNTTNVSLKRTGSNNHLLYVNTTGYSGSKVDLRWGNYYANRSYPTTSKPGSADKDNLSSYNEQNPYYVLTYKLEQSGDRKIPPGGNTTATLLCDAGATGYKVKDDRYLVAAKQKLDEIKHTVQYSSTDIYQRNLLPTSKVEYRTVWLVDANSHQVVELLLELVDNTGKYDDAFIRVKKAIGGAERTITEQYFDAEEKTVGYLINGEKYSVEVVSKDRKNSRSIGNLYVDTVDLTKTIRIQSKFDVNPDSGNVSFNLYRSGSSINLDFAFPDGQVGKAELKIFNYSNGKQQQKIYEDSLTNKSSGGLTWNYNASKRKNQTIQAKYLINSSKFGKIQGSQLFDISYSTPLKNLNVDANTLKAFAVFMIIIVPMFFNPSIARLGAITQVLAAGFFNMIGWIDLSTAAMSSAGTLSLAAILIAIDAYAESEYSRTNRRSTP